MSTSVIEPGTRLAGRYRLEERIAAGGSTLWKAKDEILARAVAVRTFDDEFPRVREVVTSARAASRLTDPRLTQVFDADDTGENAYVVSEWVVGETLEQMLLKAPLEPGRAATLLYEAAEAVAAAHTAGLAHLCLGPRDLVWTTGGTVKILGVATDAVLGDRYADDPGARDARGLGEMLYAALTAHWPGDPERSVLPAAPRSGDTVQAPRLVQAGIPHPVDAIVCRCLGVETPGQAPLTSPAEVAAALRGVPRTPLPLFAGLGNTPPPRPSAHRPEPAARRTRNETPPRRPAPPPSAPATAPVPRPPARRPGNRALLGVAAAALTVIVGLGAWALSDGGGDGGGTGASGRPTTKTSGKATPTASTLRPTGATPFQDPAGEHPDDQIGRDPGAVIDGRPGTTWETQTYRDTAFGNLVNGLGVVLDMGGPVKVTSVKIAGLEGGGTLAVRVGDGSALGDLRSAGKATAQAGTTTIQTGGKRGTRVLVWFTELPPSCKGRIGEITVYGTK
ncbi:Serine/threonine-protein kinase PrkC [Actinomadura rubteroloni]|uniref:Serine/threonine-protein kinase PrkC n=1 Tax=Actinomadura rubteroloni TaxID=1926885 RepID=A0A2P4UMH5_9ACTN|nr:protein kinase family protein [Actinomadura rubteroloni]POM26253.1 Serine/threonine-protein kinase PrkC [Actinomadura rubteroloni]